MIYCSCTFREPCNSSICNTTKSLASYIVVSLDLQSLGKLLRRFLTLCCFEGVFPNDFGSFVITVNLLNISSTLSCSSILNNSYIWMRMFIFASFTWLVPSWANRRVSQIPLKVSSNKYVGEETFHIFHLLSTLLLIKDTSSLATLHIFHLLSTLLWAWFQGFHHQKVYFEQIVYFQQCPKSQCSQFDE